MPLGLRFPKITIVFFYNSMKTLWYFTRQPGSNNGPTDGLGIPFLEFPDFRNPQLHSLTIEWKQTKHACSVSHARNGTQPASWCDVTTRSPTLDAPLNSLADSDRTRDDFIWPSTCSQLVWRPKVIGISVLIRGYCYWGSKARSASS